MDDQPFHWEVVVRDARERFRRVRVGARGGRVVVVPPPGEGFSMKPSDARYFAASLRAAADRVVI